jgi:pyruvate dehydrogenase E1 component beta subunit
MRELAYYEAKFEALDEIMAADQRVHLINGTFLSLSPHRHVFQNLKEKYSDRMMSPPISELGFAVLATGGSDGWTQADRRSQHRQLYLRSLAAGGQRSGQCIFHVRRSDARSGGISPFPRLARRRRSAALRQPPGDAVELPRTGNRDPSSPRDVKGLLKSAVASDNPTIFVDHTRLLDIRGEVPENDKPIPFGVADVKRAGRDVTVIATSYTVQVALRAAATLAQEGIEAEVVDPRTLVPFDLPTILQSVEKTHRVVIADETHQSCGVAARSRRALLRAVLIKLKAPIRECQPWTCRFPTARRSKRTSARPKSA